jgi:hypothetical protein
LNGAQTNPACAGKDAARRVDRELVAAQFPRPAAPAMIRAVVAGSESRSVLSSFVPPKTQSFVRGMAYMSGGPSQTTAWLCGSLGTITT